MANKKSSLLEDTVTFIIYLIILITILSWAIKPANALKPVSVYDDPFDCELVAKDVKSEKGGDLVFLMVQKPNGANDVDAMGHFINRVNINGKIIFIDYELQMIMNSEQEVQNRYRAEYQIAYNVYPLGGEARPSGIKYKY